MALNHISYKCTPNSSFVVIINSPQRAYGGSSLKMRLFFRGLDAWTSETSPVPWQHPERPPLDSHALSGLGTVGLCGGRVQWVSRWRSQEMMRGAMHAKATAAGWTLSTLTLCSRSRFSFFFDNTEAPHCQQHASGENSRDPPKLCMHRRNYITLSSVI